MTWNQKFGYVFGAVYVVVGVVGFAVTSGVGFADASGDELIIFELNPLHNLVHIAIGGVLMAAAGNATQSRIINLTVGGTYLAVGTVGLFITGSDANILALNHPDNVLHLATATLAILAGASPALRGEESVREGSATG